MINLSLKSLNLFTLIYLVQLNKILLIKRHESKKLLGGKLIGLGGKIEPGEDLLSSAKREFLEESGLTLQDPTFKGTYIWIDGDFVGISYLITATKFTGKLLNKSSEGELSWYDINEIKILKDFAKYQKDFLPAILKENCDFYTSVSVWNKNKLVSHLDTNNCPLRREELKD